MSLAESAARLAMTVASRDRLSVLIYHRVPAEPDELLPGEPCAAEFERTMRWVKSVFNVIPLEEGVAGIKSGKLPPRALSITFDDGYANNETVAAPILKRLGLHATFFIATGFLDGGRMFNDTIIEAVRSCEDDTLDLRSLDLGAYRLDDIRSRRAAIDFILEALKYKPDRERADLAQRVGQLSGLGARSDLMMTSAQVASLAGQGFEVGGHTCSHLILASASPAEAKAEIVLGRKKLEEISGRRVELFAYPNGRPKRDFVAATIELVKEAGFRGAVSTSLGSAKVGSDVYQIPRFTPWDAGQSRFAARICSNLLFSDPEYVSSSV